MFYGRFQIWQPYVRNEDVKISLLEPYTKLNRKSCIENLMCKFGDIFHHFKASIFHEEVPLEISSDQHDIVRNLKTLVMLNCEAFGVL